MAKRKFDLLSTGKFLVDTMRPRRIHSTVEGHRARRSPALEAALLVVVLLAIAAGVVWGLRR